MSENNSELEFHLDETIYYRGIKINLKRSDLSDLRLYGIDPEKYIIEICNDMLVEIRDKKIRQILGSEN